ncbi:hypothetical protein C2G38_2234084 [Gigaspora rosea]|uniref:Uncharacterized protein n=1 Tax=Gigaspora rosea TaxID=44941 RepID=A0A397TUZ0_9GLOM|nr:hypothetical protein C2G38_2234084 [Gigaspora rosea]
MNENSLLKQEIEQIRSDHLLRQENKRIIEQEINLLYQLIVQKDEMFKELQARIIEAQSNFQNNFKDLQKSKERNKALLRVLKSKIENCTDNKKKIADQKVEINKLIEQLKIAEKTIENLKLIIKKKNFIKS